MSPTQSSQSQSCGDGKCCGEKDQCCCHHQCCHCGSEHCHCCQHETGCCGWGACPLFTAKGFLRLIAVLVVTMVLPWIIWMPTQAEFAWYDALVKPAMMPPKELCHTVWMGLYFIMGLAFWGVLESHYRNPGHRICFAVGLFVLQFAATLMWGWAFFGHLSIPGGLLCSTIICALVFLTMVKFFKHSPFAGGLMLVYFMWTLLDCYLIFKVAELNP